MNEYQLNKYQFSPNKGFFKGREFILHVNLLYPIVEIYNYIFEEHCKRTDTQPNEHSLKELLRLYGHIEHGYTKIPRAHNASELALNPPELNGIVHKEAIRRFCREYVSIEEITPEGNVMLKNDFGSNTPSIYEKVSEFIIQRDIQIILTDELNPMFQKIN